MAVMTSGDNRQLKGNLDNAKMKIFCLPEVVLKNNCTLKKGVSS